MLERGSCAVARAVWAGEMSCRGGRPLIVSGVAVLFGQPCRLRAVSYSSAIVPKVGLELPAL